MVWSVSFQSHCWEDEFRAYLFSSLNPKPCLNPSPLTVLNSLVKLSSYHVLCNDGRHSLNLLHNGSANLLFHPIPFPAQNADISLLLKLSLTLCSTSDVTHVAWKHYWTAQWESICEYNLHSATLIPTVICLKMVLPKDNYTKYQLPDSLAEKDHNHPSVTNIVWTLLSIQRAVPPLFTSPSLFYTPTHSRCPLYSHLPCFFLAAIVN